MTGDRTEAELAHVAMAAADAVVFLEQHAIRRLAARHGPRAVRTHVRLSQDQLDEAYRREGLRNPRRLRAAATPIHQQTKRGPPIDA